MNFINLFRAISYIYIFSLLVIGCSSEKYLPECGEIIKSDSIKYFVSGMMDHFEFEKKWIKERVIDVNTSEWIENYVNRKMDIEKTEIDSIYLATIQDQEINNYIQKWQQIERKLLVEDQIFYYSTPKEYWEALAGQDGLVVIRKCKLVYVLVLSQS